MYLKNISHQNHRNLFLVFCILINTLLSGCQTLPNYYANFTAQTSHDDFAIHAFALDKNQDIVGSIAIIQSHENDTLPDIARHFGLGYNDITIANSELEPWLLKQGDQVVLPTRYIIPDVKRKGIILNLASMRLFQFQENYPNHLITYPIGIGRDGWSTPTGLTKIIEKKKNPAWRVPISIRREHARKGDPLPRIVPSGPDNPLGDYAMRLGIPSYLIHGTNKPYGVGMQISHGCVRLYPENIATLFQQTSRGTPVRIIDQPYLLGWDNGMLFLEAHKPTKGAAKTHTQTLLRKLKRISRKNNEVDWQKVKNILTQAKGVPIPILNGTADFSTLAKKAITLTHPQRFFHQPVVKPLSSQDWSITVATFSDEDTAQKLVALLNHQGPPIPTRKIQESGASHVVAGPFSSKQEVNSVIANIKRELKFNVIAHPPNSNKSHQYSRWTWDTLMSNIL